MSPKNDVISYDSIIYVSDLIAGFFLSYEIIVDLLITNSFPTTVSQLPHHHSKVVANLNDKEISSNNGTRVFYCWFSKRAKGFTLSASLRYLARFVTSILSRVSDTKAAEAVMAAKEENRP